MNQALSRHLELPVPTSGIRVARVFVGDVAREVGLPTESTIAAELAVSELVTNAIVHGRPPIHLQVDIGLTDLRVGVSDAGTRDPKRAPLDLESTVGRGFAIVTAVTDRCGRDDRTEGTHVWFTVSR